MADFDYIIIGSGFGGSVSALRLAEKGYSVAVIEKGRRFEAKDFPKSNFNIWKYLWLPKLGCYGFQALTLLKDILVLHGTGVGGGSLVYANTLMEPHSKVFTAGDWSKFKTLQHDLSPHYERAKKMLGVTMAECQTEGEMILKEVAADMGREHTFVKLPVGVFFGEPEKTVSDPYFGGKGPERAGCNLCGGCMTGCRYNAKNTLDKNYLYFAEQLGVKVIPSTEVEAIMELPRGGYNLRTKRTGSWLPKKNKTFSCKGVVVSGGVIGTLSLLLNSRDKGYLPKLSQALGTKVRTNSETILGARTTSSGDYSKGIAISAGFHPDDHTHIQVVRYEKGHDLMSFLSTLAVDKKSPWPRPFLWLITILTHPLRALRNFIPFGFAQKAIILLLMQPVDNYINVTLARRWWWPFKKGLLTKWSTAFSIPKYFPIGQEVSRSVAKKIKGYPCNSLADVLFNVTTTAHILGGCPIGDAKENGVIDIHGKVFGYDHFYICDGSVVSCNLGVNPSLTITALSEYFMSHIPEKDR